MIYNAKLTNCSISPDNIQADENGMTKFKIVANAGSRMEFYDEAIVIDMGNLKMSQHGKTLPILYNHNWQEPIGHATVVANDGNEITIEAVSSFDSEKSREIMNSLRQGFPWQASLGFSVKDGRRVKRGESETVNGREETCCTIATDIELWECSIVLYGADNNTSCDISAMKNKEDMENINKPDNIAQEPAQDVITANAPNPVEDYRQAMAKEQERVEAIQALGLKYNASVKDAIANGTAPNDFELDLLRQAHSAGPAIHVNNAEANLDSQVLEVCALRQANIPLKKNYSEKVLEAADKHRYSEFRDLVEAITGYNPTYAQRHDGAEWLAGVSNYSLDSLMVNTTNAVLEAAWYQQDLSWEQWCKVSTTPDFKTYERYRITSDFKFKKVEPAGEFEHGAINDYKLPGIVPETYGRQQAITWQDIVNGNTLGVWTDIMTRFAWGANQAIQEVIYTGWLANNADADGNNFFSAAHGNLLTGKALTVDNLSAATTAFVLRKRGMKGYDKDEPLGIKPEILLVPYGLRYTAEMITKATLWQANPGNPMDYNPHLGQWKVICTPALQDSTYGGGYSDTSWYLLANPSMYPTGEIVFLNGQRTPTIRQADMEIGKLGIRFDGHVSFGYGVGDYRGGMKIEA